MPITNSNGPAFGCRGLLGFLFGHKFIPRYHQERSSGQPLDLTVVQEVMEQCPTDEYVADIIDALNDSGDSNSTYVCDVCTRCGATIEPSR